LMDELRQEIKKDVGKWEEALLKWAYKVGRQVAVVLLEEMDDELMRGRGSGDVWIGRRMYRDEEGKYRYLWDERP